MCNKPNNSYCKIHFSECGTGRKEYCYGCNLNPDGSKLTYDEFRDSVYYWNCDACVYCSPKADMNGIESTCKRLDHKKYSFAKAVFRSYDCGQRGGCICSDFKPKESHVWFHNHWNDEYVKEKGERISNTETMSICINHDWEVRYEVLLKDFFYNTFKNEDDSLKWIRKGYSKQSRTSPTGWIYVYEYPDGYIQIGANQPILLEYVKRGDK